MTFRTTGKLTDFHTFTKIHGTTVQMFSVFDATTAILTSAIPPIRRQTSTTDIEHLIKLLLRVLPMADGPPSFKAPEHGMLHGGNPIISVAHESRTPYSELGYLGVLRTWDVRGLRV
jgi:hypothetical protein